MLSNKKGFLQISFQWLFAIIVGIFILFLAIYASTKLISNEQTALDAKTGKEIGILLNPLETGFEKAKTTSLSMPVNTRINNKCKIGGTFGKQGIKISQKSFNKWTETDITVEFQNKYIFSEEFAEGEKFYLLFKPFEFPFKTADLIYLTSAEDNYCFKNAPSEIVDEISLLNQPNLFVDECPANSIEICFNGGNCNIEVDYNAGFVKKGNDFMYFETDALMYAAIFSEKDIYECQVLRLMQRISELSLVYKDKSLLVSRANCNTNLELIELNNLATNVKSSNMLNAIAFKVDEIREKNDLADCKLW